MDGIEKSWQSIQLILAAHFRKEKDDFPSYFWTLVCVLGTELKTVCVYVFLTLCIVLSLLKHNSKRAINSLRGLGQINTLNWDFALNQTLKRNIIDSIFALFFTSYDLTKILKHNSFLTNTNNRWYFCCNFLVFFVVFAFSYLVGVWVLHFLLIVLGLLVEMLLLTAKLLELRYLIRQMRRSLTCSNQSMDSILVLRCLASFVIARFRNTNQRKLTDWTKIGVRESKINQIKTKIIQFSHFPFAFRSVF